MDSGLECRVCRGGEEPELPLVAPCSCSGSILCIHQECLEEWMKYSGKTKCEVCSHKYVFSKLYDPDMPKEMPFSTLLVSIMGTFFKIVAPFLFRITIVITLWFVLLPIVTSWLYRLWIHKNQMLEIPQFTQLENEIVPGIIIAGVVALSFLVLMSFVDFL